MSEQKKHYLHIGKVDVPGIDKKEKVPEYMQGKWFPGFPTTTMIVGQPGRGKTNLVISLLKSPQFYKGFFDKIYLFGPTCKSDDLYKSIHVPEDQIITEIDDFLPRLSAILEEQQTAVEADWNSADKLLFVFEDLTSLFNLLQQSKEFIRCYTQIRHLKGSVISNVHKYKAFNRTCRMASLHIILFRVNRTDISQIFDDFAPANVSKKEFLSIARFAMKEDEHFTHPFFYINLQCKNDNQVFRKTFEKILDTSGLGKEPVKKKAKKRKREEDEDSYE